MYKQTIFISAFFLLVLLTAGVAQSATLYQWVDSAGETRFGYRPPPGVIGTVVGERARQLQGDPSPVNCKALQDEHLRLIDREIARLRNISVGTGPQYEFTAEGRQRFINDLLAHRAALLTGRSAQEFSAPDTRRELNDLQTQYQQDRAKLKDELEEQARQLKQEKEQLEQQRSQYNWWFQRYPAIYPGYIF